MTVSGNAQQLQSGAAPVTVAYVAERSTALRLNFLDGLRALLALAVVIIHAFEMFGLGIEGFFGVEHDISGMGDSPVAQTIRFLYVYLVSHFGYAVEAFIVVSGFSMMLPVARTVDLRIKGGFLGFMQRRARRILPPYYAALVFSILIFGLIPGLNQPSTIGALWDLALPVFDWGVIISHLLLIHNVNPEWFGKINLPLWTIAVEWQLYFLFTPLVLLARRWGIFAMVAIASALGIGQLALPFSYPLSQPLFLGLFAMGMSGALIGFSKDPGLVKARQRIPWVALALLLLVLSVGVSVLIGQMGLSQYERTPLGLIIGLAVTCLLVGLTTLSELGKERHPALQVLNSMPLVNMGRFSYSLYLIHFPTLAAVAIACLHLNIAFTPAHLIVIGPGSLLCIAVAWFFYKLFEEPFLPSGARVKKEA